MLLPYIVQLLCFYFYPTDSKKVYFGLHDDVFAHTEPISSSIIFLSSLRMALFELLIQICSLWGIYLAFPFPCFMLYLWIEISLKNYETWLGIGEQGFAPEKNKRYLFMFLVLSFMILHSSLSCSYHGFLFHFKLIFCYAFLHLGLILENIFITQDAYTYLQADELVFCGGDCSMVLMNVYWTLWKPVLLMPGLRW